MSTNIYKNKLVESFAVELGVLLSVRIAEYIRKHHKGNEFAFLNQFIICPQVDDGDYDDVRYALSAKQHFDKNFNINFGGFELVHIAVTDQKKVQYSFHCYPNFLDENYDDDFVYFSLIEKKIFFGDQWMIDMLEEYDNDCWNKVLVQLKQELMFGTLKNT